jgi:hypothetical protein
VSIGYFLDNARTAGKGKPEQKPLSPRFTQPACKRCGDPDAPTVEAVLQRSPKAIANKPPQPHNDVPRPVFGFQEVCYAPSGEYTESEMVRFHVLVQSEIRRPVYPQRHHETLGEISKNESRQPHGVIGIGFASKRYLKSGDFFRSGRSIPACVT